MWLLFDGWYSLGLVFNRMSREAKRKESLSSVKSSLGTVGDAIESFDKARDPVFREEGLPPKAWHLI